MALSDLERLVSDAKENKQLVSHFALLGHDTGAFVQVANKLGYNITTDDVNTYVAQRTAAVRKGGAGAVAAAVADSTAAVTSTVAAAVTAVAGATGVVGAVEGAVLVAEAVVLT